MKETAKTANIVYTVYKDVLLERAWINFVLLLL